MTQRLGKAWIKVDGDMLETMPGASLDIGGVNRTTVTGNNAVLGYAEAPMPSHLECEIAVGPTTSLKKIADIKTATITFEADSGQTWVMRNAWLTAPPKVTDGEGGKVPLVFEGPPAEEMGV